MNKNVSLNLIIDAVIMVTLIILDQLSKAWAVLALKEKQAISLIPGVLELNYLENRGAAFGMLQNQKWFFIFVAIIILGCILYILIKAPLEKKYIKLHILLTLIASGAIGNMIDRISLNYVVDFIYFKLINFPIFNVADIYVTVSTFVLVILLIFVFDEEDLKFLSFRSNKYKRLNADDSDNAE